MKASFPGRFGKCVLAVAIVLAVVSTNASADFISTGGGDYNLVPLYHSYAFGGIDRDSATDNGYASEDIDGVDYVSNTAPSAPINSNTFVSANGATMTGNGQTTGSGFYAGRSSASLSVTNSVATDTYYQVAGTGTATSVRFFTADAAAQNAVFTWKVSGTESNPSGYGTTTGRLDFGASTDPTVNWLNLFSDPGNALNSITEYGPGTYAYNLPIADLGTTINLFYWSSAFASVQAGEAPAGSSFSLSANYFNTYELEKVELFDANNNPIKEWSLKDLNLNQDVFNQNGRLVEIDAPPVFPTPEPGSLALLASGALTLALVRRRGR